MNFFKLVKKAGVLVLLPFMIHTTDVIALPETYLSQIWSNFKYCKENLLHRILKEFCLFNSVFYQFLNFKEVEEYSRQNNELYRNFMLDNEKQVIKNLRNSLQYANSKLNNDPPCLVLLKHKKRIQKLLNEFEQSSEKSNYRPLVNVRGMQITK